MVADSDTLSPQRLWATRLVCWLAIPLALTGGYLAVSTILGWLFSRSSTSVNYTLAYCVAPILIYFCPALVQWLVLRIMGREFLLPFRSWVLASLLPVIIGWICLLIFFLGIHPATVAEDELANLINQALWGAFVGGVLGAVIGLGQWFVLDHHAPSLTRGWIPLSISGWIIVWPAYVLIPFLLRPAPLPVINATPITPACTRLPTSGLTLAPAPSTPALQPQPAGGHTLKLLASTLPEATLKNVTAVAFSPDGRIIAAGGEARIGGDDPKSLVLVDTVTGAPLMTPAYHPGQVTSLAFSPDGGLLAGRYKWDGAILLYDVTGGQVLATWPGQPTQGAPVAFSPDGTILASGDDTMVKLREVTDRAVRAAWSGHTGPVTAVVFSPDGAILASGSADATIRLWDVASGAVLAVLKGHASAVTSLAFSRDGRILASGNNSTEEYGVRLWAVPEGQPRQRLSGYAASSVAFSADGQTVVIGSDSAFLLWTPTTGQLVTSAKDQLSGFYTVAVSPDGQTIATGGQEGLLLWEMSTGRVRAGYGFYGTPTAIAFSPDGRMIASSNRGRDWSPTVQVWQISDDHALLPALRCNAASTESLVFSPDEQALASVGGTGNIRLWGLADGALRATLQPGVSGATNQGVNIPSASLWSATEAITLSLRTEADNDLGSITLSPDGRWVAGSRVDHTIQLWAAASGEGLASLKGHTDSIYTLAFSSDSARLASAAYDKTIKVWEVQSSRLMATIPNPGADEYLLAFSPDNQILASAGGDESIRLWQVSDRKLLTTLGGHSDRVTALAFSPDGRVLASAAEETIRLWDVASEHMLFQTEPTSTRSFALAFSPDGTRLAALQEDGVVTLWQVQ